MREKIETRLAQLNAMSHEGLIRTFPDLLDKAYLLDAQRNILIALVAEAEFGREAMIAWENGRYE